MPNYASQRFQFSPAKFGAANCPMQENNSSKLLKKLLVLKEFHQSQNQIQNLFECIFFLFSNKLFVVMLNIITCKKLINDYI
jgi:hypothetical protein